MPANPYTVVENDTRPERVTSVARHEYQDAQGGADGAMKTYEDEVGQVAEIGRGASDPNVTYFALYNTNNTKVYFYPTAAGDGLQVSTVKP